MLVLYRAYKYNLIKSDKYVKLNDCILGFNYTDQKCTYQESKLNINIYSPQIICATLYPYNDVWTKMELNIKREKYQLYQIALDSHIVNNNKIMKAFNMQNAITNYIYCPDAKKMYHSTFTYMPSGQLVMYEYNANNKLIKLIYRNYENTILITASYRNDKICKIELSDNNDIKSYIKF